MTADKREERARAPVGIVDIGSNSVRFVAYDGPRRVPFALFNEKVMAGLGRGIADTGRLDEAAMARALSALRRFRLLARQLRIERILTVATAAVRDASNGREFMREVKALGFEPMLIPGREEAELAGFGLLSAIPEADGIGADLGGGSLELMRVRGGEIGERVSLPLGVLRVQPGAGVIADAIRLGLRGTGLARSGRGRPLFLIGGSWRALAQIDLHASAHPLPIVHAHRIAPERLPGLGALVAGLDKERAKAIPQLSGSRLPTLPAALDILEALGAVLGSNVFVLSAHGLREGLLYRDLSADERRDDPLLAGARAVAQRYGRFGEHGVEIDRWIAPAFPGDSLAEARLRLAACLLADIAWGSHPDFRAERAVDLAVHGNWVGIDAPGRAVLGLTLHSAFGGTHGFDPRLAALAPVEAQAKAARWGLAIRLAQRFSGGVEAPLEGTRLQLARGMLVLLAPPKLAPLYGESVARRHKQLATAMGAEARFAEI